MLNYFDIISEGLFGLPTDKRKVITLLAHLYDIDTVAKMCHCSPKEVQKIADQAQRETRQSSWPRVRESVSVSEGKGKGGHIFQDDNHVGELGYGEVVSLEDVMVKVAGHLGWKRTEDAKQNPYLHDIHLLASKVYPRVFTKSNVEFRLYAIILDDKGKAAGKNGKYGGAGIYIVVAAKRRSASWNTRGEDTRGNDPHSVTYFRIPIVVGNAVEDEVYAQKIRRFTQEYKKRHANSEVDGSIK